MSVLVVELVGEGMVFGADKNITSFHRDGTTSQTDTRPKVHRWPRGDVLFGSVGAATLGGKPVEEWLEDVRHEFESIAALGEMAARLRDRIQAQRAQDEGQNAASPMIIHLGGFAPVGRNLVPEVWHLGNTHKLGRFGYLDVRKDYHVVEAFRKEIKEIDPSEIRDLLRVQAKQLDPFWFHQGIDLATFNVLQDAMKSAFRLLCTKHPRHDVPTTLAEWENHVRLQILMYGAYYEAFHPQGARFVGGGADVLSLAWPVA